MTNMKRTTVFLTREQLKELAKVARSKGFTVAQCIRLAVVDWLRKERQ